MDGFALRLADIESGTSRRLSIAGTVVAGHLPARAIRDGEAARIFTGAVLPAGAERVVVQELCREIDGEVVVNPPPAATPHIHRRAEDMRMGDTVSG